MTIIKPFQPLIDVTKEVKKLGFEYPERLTGGGFRLWFNETFDCQIENAPINAVAKAMAAVLDDYKQKKGKAK